MSIQVGPGRIRPAAAGSRQEPAAAVPFPPGAGQAEDERNRGRMGEGAPAPGRRPPSRARVTARGPAPGLRLRGPERRPACPCRLQGAGATLSHHHGTGRDFAPFFAREHGPGHVAALRALKAHLDPAGVLNPGVFFPAG
ncbi:hypothetical protein DYI95_008035 [Thermaerobacter sp. PB12/4term]|uniref:FAD-binding oxidoreductase n=1 Tax=Thermaerobacter sp. PB12/4term TaxID=2293838 RepID=UPI000E3274C3|nr:hypothetical protein DYI95_008035 [Thermaerobacter sp. PB12/4term]